MDSASTSTVVQPTAGTAAAIAKPNVHYYYFGRRVWPQHRGIVTAAAIVLDEEKHTMRVAFAFCSPADQFHRTAVCLQVNGSKEAPEVHAGGREIAGARLGVTDWPDEPLQFYEGTYTRGLLDGVIRIFNYHMPKADKPQLWHNRVLMMASRIFFKLAGTSSDELRGRVDFGDAVIVAGFVEQKKVK